MKAPPLTRPIFLCATLLGLLGLLLFSDKSGNALPKDTANIFVWLFALFLAGAFITWKRGINLGSDGKLLVVPVLFFSSAFIWKGDQFLLFWNGALATVLFALLSVRCRGPWKLSSVGYTEYVRLAILGKLTVLFWPLLRTASPPSASEEPKAEAIGHLGRLRRFVPTLAKGTLFSILPIGIFYGLFATADPVFAHYVNNLFQWNIAATVAKTAWFSAFAWLGTGALYVALQREPIPNQLDTSLSPINPTAPRRVVQPGEITVALSLINILFAAFVMIQLQFLFGGASVLSSAPGLTYPEYARQGFFQLTWAASLTLPVLLFSHWSVRMDPKYVSSNIGRLTGLLTFFVFIIIIAAFKRMWLYEAMWGLTEKRVLVSCFICSIGCVFLWFLATAWRGKSNVFAVGVLVISLLTVGSLNLINTDALIVKVDAGLKRGLAQFSPQYLLGLGPDAVPEIVAHIQSVAPEDRGELAQCLMLRWGQPETKDWRQWNASEASARAAVARHMKELNGLINKGQSCDCDDDDEDTDN